jgi:CheY-like chemotaxis protein
MMDGPDLSPRPPCPTDGPPRSVLLIDDDPGTREILASLLRRAGHAVEEADSGLAGLMRFTAHPPDIGLTDFAMPDLSGWEVARAVKALDPRVPVVYVTGMDHTMPPQQWTAAEASGSTPGPATTLPAVIRLLTATRAHEQLPFRATRMPPPHREFLSG